MEFADKGISKKCQEIRLISIESQPKKVVVFVVVIIVDPKNLTLKLGKSWVNNKGYYIVVIVLIFLVLLLLLIQKQSFKT